MREREKDNGSITSIGPSHSGSRSLAISGFLGITTLLITLLSNYTREVVIWMGRRLIVIEYLLQIVLVVLKLGHSLSTVVLLILLLYLGGSHRRSREIRCGIGMDAMRRRMG